MELWHEIGTTQMALCVCLEQVATLQAIHYCPSLTSRPGLSVPAGHVRSVSSEVVIHGTYSTEQVWGCVFEGWEEREERSQLSLWCSRTTSASHNDVLAAT